jgi:glycosyltransferase involved in cell wall biosynthesis
MSHLISICLPTFNSVKFLEKRINSILAQTFTNWHIINVDSGSTDGTVELLKNLVPQKKITYIVHPPGLYQSWNRCLDFAQGKYIHFATSDDYEERQFYEKMVSALQRTKARLIHCHYLVIDGQNRLLWRSKDTNWLSKKFGFVHSRTYSRDRTVEFMGNLFLGPSIGTANSMLIHADVFNEWGRWPENYGAIGDWLWYMLTCLEEDFFCLDEELVSWRLHQNQTTKNYARMRDYKPETFAAHVALKKFEAFHSRTHQQINAKEINALIYWITLTKKATTSKKLFYFYFILWRPDVLIHAVTKLMKCHWAPFLISHLRLKKFLKWNGAKAIALS